MLLFLGVCALGLIWAAPASAETFGQIGTPWGEQGSGPAQFFNPGAFGVDSRTGDVYAADMTEENVAFRIQKLSESGEFLASAEIERKVGGIPRSLVGIAVDPERHRFYVVEACPVLSGSTTCVASGKTAAVRVLAFDTEPTGAALPAAGSFALPSGEGEIYEPKAVATDPSNGDVLLLGEDATGHRVVQRIGAGGEIGARFVDSAGILSPTGGRASSLAVGPDGTAYMLTGGRPLGAGAKLIRGWQLSQDMSELKEVPGFAEAEAAELWENNLTGEPGGFIRGPTLAVSPDGKTLYWDEKFIGTHEPALVRAFSLADRETVAIYGKGQTTCKIESSAPAGPGIGAVGERLIAFEYGPNSTAKPSSKAAYGRKVYVFGPGGGGCPSITPKPPIAKFTIDQLEEGATAAEREPLVFDASGSELHGGVREELIWTFGDGQREVVRCPTFGNGECSEPASATTTHRYTSACECKVELEMKLRSPRAGNPPVASHTVTIEFRERFGLTVTKAGGGAGLVSSDWSGIYCGEVCRGEFEESRKVTLIPAPAPGSFFAGWSGACAGAGLCQVTMNAARSVTAVFEPLPPAATAEPVAAASAAVAAPTAPPAADPKATAKKSSVPSACRKLTGRALTKCVARHQAKAGKKKHKKRYQGSGKGNR